MSKVCYYLMIPPLSNESVLITLTSLVFKKFIRFLLLLVSSFLYSNLHFNLYFKFLAYLKTFGLSRSVANDSSYWLR